MPAAQVTACNAAPVTQNCRSKSCSIGSVIAASPKDFKTLDETLLIATR